MEAVVFCGIQASGKTTFYLERFFKSHVRLNLDMLKTRHRERVLLNACLETGQRFVVDNTNPTASERRRYVEPAIAAGFRVVGYFFATPRGRRSLATRVGPSASGSRSPGSWARTSGRRSRAHARASTVFSAYGPRRSGS